MGRQRLRDFPTARLVALAAILCASFATLFYAGATGAVVASVVLAGLALGVAVAPRRRREAQAAVGRCSACSYDLTGNASGVCPECGTLIESARTHPIRATAASFVATAPHSGQRPGVARRS